MAVKAQLGDSDESEDALRLRPDPARQPLGGGLRAVDATLESTLGGTAAPGGAAPLGFAELRRCSALQGGDLAVDSALTPQGLDRLGDLLTCRDGGPNRCIGNPLRSPAQ